MIIKINFLPLIPNIDSNKLFLAPNHKKIPQHITTQYVCDRYQEDAPVAKTKKIGIKPEFQRKTLKTDNNTATLDTAVVVPMTHVASQARKSVAMPKAARKNPRKVNKKAALADRFDNYKSNDAVQQDKQEWLDSVVRELNKVNLANTKEKQFETLYFVISYKNELEKEAKKEAVKFEIEQLKAYKTYLQGLDEAMADWEMAALINYNYDIDTRSDINKYLAEFDAKEAIEIAAQKERETIAAINASVADRFVKNTSEAMRAFEKQKRHNTKLARILHELQITK